MTTPKHGTYAGWNWHKRNDVAVCIACQEAQRQYKAAWRQANPNARSRNNQIVRANERAKLRLKEAHPDEYRTYYLEELAKQRAEAAS